MHLIKISYTGGGVLLSWTSNKFHKSVACIIVFSIYLQNISQGINYYTSYHIYPFGNLLYIIFNIVEKTEYPNIDKRCLP